MDNTMHYDNVNLGKIEELKEILRGYHARRETGDINKSQYDNAIEKFVSEYGSDYDFFANYGIDLLNAEHCDIREVIENFTKSNCKSWDEYCIYLLEKLINMIKTSNSHRREV